MKRLLMCLFILAVALSASVAYGYTAPQTGLFLHLNTDQLSGAAGTNTGDWNTDFPAGGKVTSSGGAPKNDVINGVKWELNNGAAADMYRFPGPGETGESATAWPTASPIACTGATIVAAIKPLRYVDGGNWNSIVDMFYSEFCLAINNENGEICVMDKNNWYWLGTGVRIPDQQTSIVSVVANATGGFTVYVNGTLAATNTTAPALTSLVPGGTDNAGYKHYINIGRNNPDTWPCFNGNIGDVLIYTTALDDVSRSQLESDLMAKFHAGPSYANQIITASAAAGTTITPSGSVSVSYEADQTFTITAQYGYSVDVVVDGVSQGNIPSYKFNDVIAAHNITVNATVLPQYVLSGTVTKLSDGTPIAGATVSVKMSAGATASQTATTDASGNYSVTVPQGTYLVCASKTGYMISADASVTVSGPVTQNFQLAAKRNIPQMENLLLAADTNDMGAVGTTGNWPLLYSTMPGVTTLTAVNTPAVTKVRGIKYDYNYRPDGDGYNANTAVWPTAIPTNGATIVALVKPVKSSTTDSSFHIITGVFYANLTLGTWNYGTNFGKIRVRRNNVDTDSAVFMADGGIYLLSLVVQPDGTFKLWSSTWNSTNKSFDAPVTVINQTTANAFTSFTPGIGGTENYRKYVTIGRRQDTNNYTFNGYIGDVFIYKTALSDAERTTLEADINTKLTSITTYNITATAGAGGSISPAGVTAVGETDSQPYTITPGWGYDIADVLVDGVSVGAVPTYQFDNVIAPHTIAASFAAKTTYAITGKVTNGTTGIAGAKVYVSATANASVAPTYVLTTDAGGNYSVNLFNGTWYFCASATGYTTSADITVTVAGAPAANPDIVLAAGKNIPQMDKLIFALYGTALTLNTAGTTTNAWPLEHPLGPTAAVIGTPALTTVDGVQWEQNKYSSGDGYRIGTYTADIPANGITATAVVQPTYIAVGGEPRGEIIDVFYGELFLAISHHNQSDYNNEGEVIVCWRGYQAKNTGYKVPNGQKTILTLVVQPTGEMVLYSNGIQVWSAASNIDYTSLKLYNNFNTITVGRNNPDGWSTFSGNIGAAMLWKTALSPDDRGVIEQDLGSRFGIYVPVFTTFSGKVTLEDGVTPVAGATITAICYPVSNPEGITTTVTSAADGTYSFSAQKDVTYFVEASKTSYQLASDLFTGTVTGPTTWDFKMRQISAITGTVKNAAGQPIANAIVQVGDGGPVAVTGADGKYLITGIDTNSYSASFYADALGYEAYTEDINPSLAANTTITKDVVLTAKTETNPSYIQNGGFETGDLTGWQFTGAHPETIEIGVTNAVKASGTYAGYWKSLPGVAWYNGYLRQRIPVVDGSTYNIYFKAKSSAAATGQIGFDFLGANGGSLGWHGFDEGVWKAANGNGWMCQLNGTWQQVANYRSWDYATKWVAARLTPPAGTTTIQLILGLGSNVADEILYIDDVVVDRVGPDPAPVTISASAGANGSISPAGDTVLNWGQSQTYTFTPSAGYAIDDVLVDGVSNAAAVAAGSYTFSNVWANHTISVTFKAAVVVKPYGVNNKSVLTDAKLVGKTVRVWGAVKQINAGSYIIDDGYGAGVTIKGTTTLSVGQMAVVTGVVQADKSIQP